MEFVCVPRRENQMMYYSDETRAESDAVASNEYVTMTGGKGVVSYKFEGIMAQRQFSGEACFSYEAQEGDNDVDIDGSGAWSGHALRLEQYTCLDTA